jgi:hypothetical protein
VKKLAVILIKRDFALQPRATLHQEWIEEYAHDMANGATFPPPVVFFDGNDYWLADGFHRVFAAEALGVVDLECDIRRGTRRDAMLFSVGANAVHGHRRTNDDKQRAIDIMLADPEWTTLPDREIARHCAVDHKTVSARRPKPSGEVPQIEPRTVTRGGTTYPMNTANIGAGRERSEPETPQSEASVPSTPAPAPPAPVNLFDWEADRIRTKAMDAILVLADQPEPEVVIAAWKKSAEFGVPVDAVGMACSWLIRYLELYRVAEPERWAGVQRRAAIQRGEITNAAE